MNKNKILKATLIFGMVWMSGGIIIRFMNYKSGDNVSFLIMLGIANFLLTIVYASLLKEINQKIKLAKQIDDYIPKGEFVINTSSNKVEDKATDFVDYSDLTNCKNKEQSYGEICVHCNKCGRFE